jgi:hypothetical protein
MEEEYLGVDEKMMNQYDKQEKYKKDKKINLLYNSFNSPEIWNYKLELFETYLPFMLEYQIENCNLNDILGYSKRNAYMNSSRNGWTILPTKKDILIDYIDDYFIKKYQGTSLPSYKGENKDTFKKYFPILTNEQMIDTFNEIMDNSKGLKYRIISNIKKYVKNNTIIIKKCRYSTKLDYRHIQANLYVKENNINIKIEEEKII